MLENLISFGSLKYRQSISGKNKLLNLDFDIGGICANSDKEAQEQLSVLIKRKIRLLSGNDIKKQCKKELKKGYYVVGKYGSPKTWKVGDCLANGKE